MPLKKLTLLDKKIKCGNIYYSFSIKIIRKILKVINEYNEKGLEVGGYIFSEEKLKNSFHGIWTSMPYKHDNFKSHSYYLDIKNEQKNININSKKGLSYSCVWHSHRENHTQPSRIDDQNILNLLKDLKEEKMLSIIFSTSQTRFIFYSLKAKNLKKKSKIVRKSNKWKNNITNFW